MRAQLACPQKAGSSAGHRQLRNYRARQRERRTSMAFNGLQPASGPFTLMSGAQMRVIMWYGDPSDQTTGQDQGAQWIMANPLANGQPPPSS
jgi:hypothetical protein